MADKLSGDKIIELIRKIATFTQGDFPDYQVTGFGVQEYTFLGKVNISLEISKSKEEEKGEEK